MSSARNHVVDGGALNTSRDRSFRWLLVLAITVLGVWGAGRAGASAFLDDRQGRAAPPTEQPPARLPPTTPEKTQSWMQQLEAADRGDAAAQFDVGARFAAGDGVPRDYVQAVKWWRRAAAQGRGRTRFLFWQP